METNKIKEIFGIRNVRYGAVLVVGMLLGWLLFGGSKDEKERAKHTHAETETQVWTCSMHPQIKQDKPGKCPLCAMDLIPLKTAGGTDVAIDLDAIMLSKEAAALANIQTTTVSRSNPVKEIRLYGTIQADERLLRSQVSHVNGRIEKLFVHFAGETIRQGQAIASLYSPDLLNAQQELLEAAKIQPAQPALLEAAKEKLRLWRLTEKQIAEIEKSGNVPPHINITATTSGIITTKRVEQGDYVSQGTVLFDLADLSSVWAVFDAYETDLPYLKTGDNVVYTLQALPGKTFSGKISFIDPVLDKTTRTIKVRVETANPDLQLKPEMYATAMIKTSLKQYANEIVIPKTAILWTGKRSVVYVKQPDTEMPVFTLREIELGPSLGDSYVVTSGIKDEEEIVTSGTFSVDASAQLEGKPSMMNDETRQQATSGDEQATITVQGLCDMCKATIEKAAKSVTGVSTALWDPATKQLRLTYNPKKASLDVIAKAIAKAGYDNEKYKADDAVYNTLPGCCKYRNKK